MRLRRYLMACLMGAAGAVAAHDGTVNITGTIQDKTCEISPDSVNQSVPLGTVASKDLKDAGSATRAERFTIRLEQCGAAVSGASVSFSGTPDNTVPALVRLTALPGGATGLGVELLDDAMTAIPVQSSSHQYPIEPGTGSAVLVFYARYRATGSGVTTGVANASVTFTLTYA